jgi:O-antigen ligase
MILLALSFSQIAYAIHPRKGPFIGYLEVVAVFFLIAWGLQVLSSRRLCALRLPPWPIWAALSVAILSLSAATSLSAGLVEVSHYLLYFILLYVMFADVFRGRIEYAWWSLIVGAAGAGLVALVQLPSVKTAVATGSHGLVASDDLISQVPRYVHGLAGTAYLHSAYMAVILPLVFAWICTAWPRRWAIVATIGLFFVAATLLGPPHVWILIAALVWVAAAIRPANWWRPAALVCVPLLVLQFACPQHRHANLDDFLNPWETGSVYKVLSDTGNGQAPPIVKKRWLEWYPALAMIADKPVLGVGAGNYQLSVGQADYWGYLPNAKKSEPDTNNLYLVIGGSMGLAGLICLVAMLYYPWRLAAACAARGDAFAVGLTAALAVLAVACVFTPLLVRGAAVGWSALMALAALRADEVVPRQGEA